MRHKLWIALVLCGCLLAGGCSFILERPENFIGPPAADVEKYHERMLINSFLADDEHPQVPREMEKPASFVDLDVDGDKNNEKLVFWTNNNGYQTGMTLLSNTGGGWYVLDQERQSGRTIDFFKLHDIDGDSIPEVFLGVDTGGNNTLHIYKSNSEGLYQIDQINYSKLAFADVRNDGKMELICSLNDLSSAASMTDINVYEWKKDGTANRYLRKSVDGFCQEFNFGEVREGIRGLYLVMSSETNTIKTVLLVPSDNTLNEVMRQDVGFVSAMSERQGGVVQDVNDDGILDVLTIRSPVDASKREPREFLQVWKNWDGTTGFYNVYAAIDNKTDGYTFKLPIEWLDNMHYQYVTEPGNNQLRFFDGERNSESEPRFTIYTRDTEREQADDEPSKMVLLGRSPSNQKVYLARINNTNFAGHALNEDILKNALIVEGGQ